MQLQIIAQGIGLAALQSLSKSIRVGHASPAFVFSDRILAIGIKGQQELVVYQFGFVNSICHPERSEGSARRHEDASLRSA
jgi:hypothetical protein